MSLTIRVPGMHVEIVDYDPSWPELYEKEQRRIRAALGDAVLRLEHVGSTSVPGLSAKPVIDILLAVTDSADESTYVPALESAGYLLQHREPEWFEHRLLKGPDTDVNLHVFTAGAREISRMLRFRDYLRDHPEERELYVHTKLDLASRSWSHLQDYADAKTPIIHDILARALLSE